mgnify:CR=1 FL=1
MPKNLVLHAQLRNKIERGVGDSSPIRTAAVLTCVAQPQPPDAFRPAFCDRQQKIYLARNLDRQSLLMFVLAVIALGRWRGVAALVGLGLSLVIVIAWILPAILDGRSPAWVAFVGASAVAFVAP